MGITEDIFHLLNFWYWIFYWMSWLIQQPVVHCKYKLATLFFTSTTALCQLDMDELQTFSFSMSSILWSIFACFCGVVWYGAFPTGVASPVWIVSVYLLAVHNSETSLAKTSWFWLKNFYDWCFWDSVISLSLGLRLFECTDHQLNSVALTHLFAPLCLSDMQIE